MSIPGSSPQSAVSVAALNDTLKMIVDSSLNHMWVKGDVSDFKKHRNGHWYFTLRDATSQMRCVVWSRDQRGIPAAPDVGMEVTVFGRVTLYAARGDLHLTVTKIETKGDGLWQKALLETQRRLEKDGLLAPSRKRRLPFFPACVAVVTSPDGAAFRDIHTVVKRRAPQVQLVLSAAKVQGEGSAEEICEAIDRVIRWGGADVMIVGRGGGSKEDLWSFNSENVARAIAASPIPVISAVGHEIDTTIADLVADLRAPTPSAAGEAVVPVRDDLEAMIVASRSDLITTMKRRLTDSRYSLTTHARTVKALSSALFQRRQASLQTLAGRMHALSPLATLARGYSVARDAETGTTLTSVRDFPAEREFVLTVKDGSVRAVPKLD